MDHQVMDQVMVDFPNERNVLSQDVPDQVEKTINTICSSCVTHFYISMVSQDSRTSEPPKTMSMENTNAAYIRRGLTDMTEPTIN